MNSRTGRRRALSLLCGVVITGVVGLGLPSAALGSASAVPVSEAAQPTAEHAAEEAMYAKDYGVTIEEAAKRLAEQDDLGEIEQKIRDLAGSRLGGVWIQHSPDFRVVARLTEGTRIDAIDRLAANEIVSVTYDAQASLDTLTSVVERQSVAWQATYPNIELISVNEHTGQVEFYVYGEAQRNTEIADYLVGTLNSDQKFRTTVGVKADLSRFVRVLQTENHVEPANPGGRNLSNGCTSGFTGYGSSLGNVGMTTAGHCANSGGWKEFGSSTVNSMTYVKEVRNAYADLQYHTMSVMYSSFYASVAFLKLVDGWLS